MTSEAGFINMMRALATHAGAGGLNDDVATIILGDRHLILTHDMMVADVHWDDNSDPADIAWKLVSGNLSDLAAKGARPLGVLLGYILGNDEWNARFAHGLSQALSHYDVPLLGGDTVGAGGHGLSVGMTAIGEASHIPVPARSGAKPGDALFVTGNVGNAKAGFDLTGSGQGGLERARADILLNAFHRPIAQLAQGQALAPIVHAMMDVSDGLLIDAQHMAKASGLAVHINMSDIPLSDEYIILHGCNLKSRLDAASWGDDYILLFAAHSDIDLPVRATRIGQFTAGEGLHLRHDGVPVNNPEKLGYQHK